MKKRGVWILFMAVVALAAGLVYLFMYVPSLSERHGVVETRLYLGNGERQPLIVAFGGGGGGNDWTRTYLKEKRDSLLAKGYAVLAIGYFKSEGTPWALDRISLDAISDSILRAAQHPSIDAGRIVLMGGSRGGELVLNLACRYPEFKGVIALSTAHVSFPAITWSANTSSWTYRGEEVPYVPAPFSTIAPALKGDLYEAHRLMLENQVAVGRAVIPVERINGPVLLVSGIHDDQWPATLMSEAVMERLREKGFVHPYVHIPLNGGHVAPLNRFSHVYDFLERHFPLED